MTRRLASRRAEVLALRGTFAYLRRLPIGSAQRLGAGLGRLAYLALARRRQIALSNLAKVFPQWCPTERRRVAGRSFESLGRLLAEVARLPVLDRSEVLSRVEYDGWETYERARAAGRGVLYLAAHFGAWELIPAAQAALGRPMSFIVRPADNPLVDELVTSYRERNGNRVIVKRWALRDCVERLRAGETVGVLIDQHVPADRGVATNLLGQPVYTSPVLAALATRTGAAILPAFAIRGPRPGHHRIVLGPEVEVVATGDRAADVAATTQRCVDVVSSHVQAHPDHWMWLHRRFRDSVGKGGPSASGSAISVD